MESKAFAISTLRRMHGERFALISLHDVYTHLKLSWMLRPRMKAL